MNEIKLSVIIPCYNPPKQMLGQCLESLQFIGNYLSHEILVVDDGSEEDWICSYVEEFHSPNIRAIRQQNMGPGGARNTGIEQTTGEYITFVDADDFILFGPYTQLLQLLVEKKPDILCQGCKRQYKGSATKYMMECDINPCCWSYFIRRKTLGNLRFTPYIVHEDEEFCTKLHLLRAYLITVNYTSYVYCYRKQSITHSSDRNHIKKRFRDFITVLEDLKSMDVHAPYKAALVRRIDILAMCYVVTLIRDSFDKSFTQEALTALKKLHLYPLPMHWRGTRYLIIRHATYYPFMVKTLTPFVKLLLKIHDGTTQKRAFVAHADPSHAAEQEVLGE